MMPDSHVKYAPYSVCTIDIGSPKLGNIGWSVLDINDHQYYAGDDLDALFPIIGAISAQSGMILGLEAPLFVPIRQDLMMATKGRQGEGRRPWSGGAGAQVLAMNLPIMIYILNGIMAHQAQAQFSVNPRHFNAKAGQIMLFEALVSGADKGASHIEDARIMVDYCLPFSKQGELPPSILEDENDVSYFNLAAAALLRCGVEDDLNLLHVPTPIYKPSVKG